MYRSLIHFIFCFCLVGACFASGSRQEEVVVIVPALEQPFTQLVDSLRNQLEQQAAEGLAREDNLQVRIVTIPIKGSSFSFKELFKPDQLVVALGFQATEFALASNQNIRVISSFVTRSAVASIQQKDKVTSSGAQLFGVLYLDQPVSRVLSLLSLVYPEAKKVGVVYGATSIQRQKEVNYQAAKHQIKVNDAVILKESNPLQKLNHVFKSSDAVIVLPDKSSFNRRIAKWVIRLSVKNKMPVIGYSRNYAQAGALASVYSSVGQIGQQTAELIYQWQTATNTQTTQYLYPKYFSISVNERVKMALGIEIGNEKMLVEQVNKLEGGLHE